MPVPSAGKSVEVIGSQARGIGRSVEVLEVQVLETG